jgi:hypothetical protein
MKKVFLFSIFMALTVMTSVNAQQISVVASGGVTTLFTDLNTAISEAASGSTIYLSGGGFRISDDTKITKKLSIIGIGHRPDNNNADGSTLVIGNFFFEGGSDDSYLMGVYLSGEVYIGTGGNAVNNFLLRYCNVNSVQVGNSSCQGVSINQNYVRNDSNGGNSAISFTNNIMNGLICVTGGIIDHNVSIGFIGGRFFDHAIVVSQIKNNLLIGGIIHNSGCSISNNMCIDGTDGDYPILIGNWDDVIVGPNNGVNPTSSFALKGSQGKNAATDGTDVGIYGGSTGFSDAALPPGPRIVSRKVADQTDANGNLHVEIKVSAQ